MARIALEIEIAAPVAVVWEITQSPARRVEWDFRVTHAELVTPTPVGKGSRLRTSGHMVVPFSYLVEYGLFVPYRKTTIQIRETKGLPLENGAGSWTYEALDGDRTRFRTSVTLTLRKTPFRDLLDRLWLAPFFRWTTQRSLRKLKRIAEQEWQQLEFSRP